MPAKRTYHPRRFEDNLAVSANGDLERGKNVHFTNQSPSFEIVIENTGNRPVEVDTHFRLSFDESKKGSESSATISVDETVDPGKASTHEMEPEMLPYQGSAAVSVDTVFLRGDDDNDDGTIRCLRSRTNSLFRLYTFMVYDRDYYRVEYHRPRRSQYLSAFLSILVVTLAVIQLWIA